jgi:hypothetical protein
MIRSWGLIKAVNAAKLATDQHCASLFVPFPADSLGSGPRVWLDVDTPNLGVKVECLESSVSAKVLEDIDVLIIVSFEGSLLISNK